jgi:hypothetical protein
VLKGSPSNAFGPPAANERYGRWLTLTPNLSGNRLRNEYPRVRYGNQSRGPLQPQPMPKIIYTLTPLAKPRFLSWPPKLPLSCVDEDYTSNKAKRLNSDVTTR